MDINDIRNVVTVLGMVLFIALVVRTWSSRAKPQHEQAAHLPFMEEGAVAQGKEHASE